MDQIIYQGNVRVYLQGRNALTLILPETPSSGYISYYIGDTNTNFVLCDHRPETVAEARQVLQTQYQNGFAKHFNQYAKAEIRYDEDVRHMKIDLHTIETQPEKCPVLWMGILENNLMPGFQVEWEIFKPIDESNTAFVAFIAPAT
jgi:hypothetical protein